MTLWQEFTLYHRYVQDAETFNASLPPGCHPADPAWFIEQRARVACRLWGIAHQQS